MIYDAWRLSLCISYPFHMPRKKALVPTRRSYHRSLKERVIYQHFTLGMDTTAISISLDIPLRVVQRVLRNWKIYGDVSKERVKGGRFPLLKGDAARVSVDPWFRIWTDVDWLLSLCWPWLVVTQTFTLMRSKHSFMMFMVRLSPFKRFAGLWNALVSHRKRCCL